MKTRNLLIGGSVALGLVAVLAWAFAPRPLVVETAQATTGRFERHIDEDAKTRVVDRHTVAAPLAGRLARITLREGDSVAAGQVVATLTPQLPPLLDARSTREQAGRVAAAEAGVARAQAALERARVGVAQAQAELRRSEQLARQGFVAPTKLDTDRLALQAAQKDQESAAQARHMADHELDTARAALAVLQGSAAGQAFGVRAPVGGRLLRVLQPSETVVAQGTPLLELGDLAQMEVVAEMLTTDALQIGPGAPVRIERWGGAGDLQGRVLRVEPGAFTKVSALGVEEQRVKVVIGLTSPRAQWQALGDGYRVAVRVLAQAQDGAVQVPVSAVFPRSDGSAGMASFTVVDGKVRLQSVTLGGRNGTLAWVREGLKPGDSVVIYPPATLVDGQRVAPRVHPKGAGAA